MYVHVTVLNLYPPLLVLSRSLVLWGPPPPDSCRSFDGARWRSTVAGGVADDGACLLPRAKNQPSCAACQQVRRRMRCCAFSCRPARISRSIGASCAPCPCAGSDFCFDCGCGFGCDGEAVARDFGFGFGFGLGLGFLFCFACGEDRRGVFGPGPGPSEHQPA